MTESPDRRKMLDDILAEFAHIVEGPYKRLAGWKESTKSKVIGCIPMHVPEEIIHAAGILPVTILAKDDTITFADHYLQPYLCSLVRSKFDLDLKGELNFLDGIVFPDLCDLTQQVPDIWRLHSSVPFMYSLPLVRGDLQQPSRRHYLAQQFTHFKQSLEQHFNLKITDEQLRQSISLYNTNRNLLNRLYEIRRSNPGLFRARDLVTVVAAGMLMPKEEHNALLKRLIDQAEILTPITDTRPKLVLSQICDQPRNEVLDLFDKLGAVIADDDLYTGSRYFFTSVNDTLEPMESLADRYVNDIPCPTKSDSNYDYGDYLVNKVKEADADGMVIFLVRFCEPLGFDYPYLRRKLSEAKVPNMMLDTEVGVKGNLEQMRTRIQAFIEMLEGSS
jgi:benzoyl-CoA reductase subunit C